MDMIPFNKPFYPDTCSKHIQEALKSGQLFRGDYFYRCIDFFKKNFDFETVIPTLSCTQALEFIAVLLNLTMEDEIIVPSYTYVSTANAFAGSGAKIVFADSHPTHPNICIEQVEKLITDRTKAIVVVHYGGFSCDLEKFRFLANKHHLFLIEDAAHSIGCKYGGHYLGSFGDFATFSFHETKNVTCGQGGMLIINNPDFFHRASLIKENGTNREDFRNGMTSKYVWMDIGSTYNLPELNCALLFAGLLEMEAINTRRKQLWDNYYQAFRLLPGVELPGFGNLSRGNGHVFYLMLNDQDIRPRLTYFLKEKGISAAGHYIALHISPYYTGKYGGSHLPNAELFTERLLRLPLFFEMTDIEQGEVIKVVLDFFEIR